jgi:hypothetical protein
VLYLASILATQLFQQEVRKFPFVFDQRSFLNALYGRLKVLFTQYKFNAGAYKPVGLLRRVTLRDFSLSSVIFIVAHVPAQIKLQVVHPVARATAYFTKKYTCFIWQHTRLLF